MIGHAFFGGKHYYVVKPIWRKGYRPAWTYILV